MKIRKEKRKIKRIKKNQKGGLSSLERWKVKGKKWYFLCEIFHWLINCWFNLGDVASINNARKSKM